MRTFPLLLLALTAATALAAPVEFTVEAPATGAKFARGDAAGKYVALHFLLKTECPICLRYTREHFKRSAELPDVVPVFLKPDRAEEIRSWVGKLGDDANKQPVIYRDPDAALARRLQIPDGYAFHGEQVHYPALVLLNPDGEEVFRYVGKNNGDRFSVDQLAAKLAELKGTAKPTTPAVPKP